jgi:hypothetical protein
VRAVWVGTVRGVVELKNKTKVSPVITAVTAADVPPPPVKVKVGKEVYPDPGLVIVIVLTAPPETVQVAVAPDPFPPEIVITGAVVYPVPPINPVDPLKYPEIWMLEIVAV